MISLPPDIYGQLKALAQRNGRPVNWEVRFHILRALTEAGLWPPADAKPD